MKRIDQVVHSSGKLKIMPDAPGHILPMFIRADCVYYQSKNILSGITAINFPDEFWEHVLYGIMRPTMRVPDYEEMVQLKDMFFHDDEVAIQVHPRASEYVDLFEMLHLWRRKTISDETEREIREHELNYKAFLMERVFPTLPMGKAQPRLGIVDGRKVLAVFTKGESGFPSWYELKALKERYWGPEEAAVQYNFGKRYDLKFPIVLLWDANSILLPPKRLV